MVCDVNKIDSNVTGLSIAEEVCLKQLPVLGVDGFDPTWYGMEPNSYSDFGGDLTTVTRQPISATRQRKKGTVTGLSASGGFNQDVTQNNMLSVLPGFFFSNPRQKPSTRPLGLNPTNIVLTSVSTTDDSYNAAAGLTKFLPGHLVKASGFSSNNGVRRVVTTATGKITVAENLVNEAAPPADAKLEAVGWQFASGAVALTASAASFQLAITGLVAGTGTYTLSGNVADADTVTIGGKVYTYRTVLTSAANDVLIGASATATLVNLAAAINRGAGAGSLYSAATIAHSQVTATSGASTAVVTAKVAGTSSNAITTTEAGANSSWGAATLASGAGGYGFVEMGIVAGEIIYIGGDLTAESFAVAASTNRPGYARVATVTDMVVTFDDATFTPQTDAGTGQTIRIFFGTVVRNEPKKEDIVVHSYQLERTLGLDSSGATQAQYIEGAIANEFKLNTPSKDKISADLTFIAMSDSTKTGLEGLKGGAHVNAPGESAFNTSLDIFRVRLAVYDPAEMNTDALFAFVQQADITINNNAKGVDALGTLGSIDVSVGNFDASGTITAIFSTVEAIRAIRNNADVGYQVIAARANGGFAFDMPLLGLGGGRLNVALNEPITLPLDAAGAENVRGYTLLSVFWPYLPTAAMPVQ